MAFRIFCLGDSIIWGQGLLPNEKFDALVQQALLPQHPEGVTLENVAHSGAVIGATGASGDPEPGEVPAPRLTIIEQCDAYSNSPDTVDLVLMNGGINDVGISSILNPFALIPSLDVRVVHACHDGMLVLLKKVSAKFSKPTCRILVTGYYSILSSQSDPLGVTKLLSLFGIAVPAFLDRDLDFINPVLERCEAFNKDSAQQLKQAIADAGDPRITFVPSGFTDANSAFVPNTTLLWGLDLTDDLDPQDPMATARRPLCDAAHDPSQILDREICYRASAGHPNVQGASQFGKQILAALP
ncbi:MAG TPA: SGNH/GDSL hydrolase family protein [Bryobacteraceae bacterium]|jgi:lysophospholipase L1-like esterase